MEQLNLFESEEETPCIKYYYSKEELENSIQSGYSLHWEEREENGVYVKRFKSIGILQNGRDLFDEGFIRHFVNEKEAKSNLMGKISKWSSLKDDMISNTEKYRNITLDAKAVVQDNVFLIPSGGSEGNGFVTVYSPHWYIDLNGFYFNLKLTYEDKMDINGRILYQLDKIESANRFIRRDIENNNTNYPFFFYDIEELLERISYLRGELNYEGEYKSKLPDLEDLINRLNLFKAERPKYFNRHKAEILDLAEEVDYDADEESEDYER